MNESIKHPSWGNESSLTTSQDRTTTREKPWRPNQSARELTESEVETAMNDLNISDFIHKFPRVDRTYADPPPPMQKIGLISFIPAKGATPNEDGIYGMAKLRGNYDNTMESNQRAEFIIRKVDSYHPIQHCYVGRPFPLTVDPRYVAETDEIDIRKATTTTMSADVKSRRDEEQNTMKDIKDREEALLAESRRAEAGEVDEDSYETYITLKVKKAQLTWTYHEHMKKMEEIRPILARTRIEIEELDDINPTYKDTYYDKYADARKKAGLTDEPAENTQSNFIKYMVEDMNFPEIDTLYEEMKNEK
jgi:hypothetical protein